MLPRSIVAAAVATLIQPPVARPPLTIGHTIPLHVEGRIDHLAYDAVHGRLFVAALGNNTVEVVDAEKDMVARTLAGFSQPQGLSVSGDAARLAVANGGTGAVDIFDATAFNRAGSARLGTDADNVRYDAVTARWWVGYGDGALAAIDPARARVLGEVKLPAHPESFQLERTSARIYVNLPDARQIAVVDRNAMKIETSWPVTAAAANFPMALDEANHRLFVGCRRPAKLLVLDTATGQLVASVAIVGDTDDLFFDRMRSRIYVIGGEGYVDVIQARGGNQYTRIARMATAAGARTALFVPERDTLYVAVPHRGAQMAALRAYRVQ